MLLVLAAGAMLVCCVIVACLIMSGSGGSGGGAKEIVPTGKWTGKGMNTGDVTDDIYGSKGGYPGGKGPLGDTRQSPYNAPDLAGSAIQPGWYSWDSSQGVPAESYKGWKFVDGLEKKVPRDWPSEDVSVAWNPFPGPGQKVLNGMLISKWGDLPAVNPPKKYYNATYNMFTSWQEGETATNEFYKKNCKPLLLSRGMLMYKGPSKFCTKGQCSPVPGGYSWVFAPPLDKSGWSHASGGETAQQFPATMDKYSTPENTKSNIIGYLNKGIEIPPWYRRGPMAKYSMDIFKKYCRAGAKPTPNCLPPGQLHNFPDDKTCGQ